MTATNPYPHFRLVKLLIRSTLVGTIAGLSALSGISLDLARPIPTPHWQQAYAQAITNQEITSYAQAVLQMDVVRRAAYAKIQDLMVGVGLDIKDFDITCPDTSAISGLPRSIRGQVSEIMTDYCNESSEIVTRNGLTVSRFNAITAAHRQDPALAERIQAELLRLQQ